MNYFVWGGTGQAIVLYEFLKNTEAKLHSLYDRNTAISSPFSGIKIYHAQDDYLELVKNENCTHFIIAIGGDKGSTRLKLQNMLLSKGFKTFNAIHPTANVATNVELGQGNQILLSSTIGASCKLGDQVIINTNSSVDHECVLGDGVHIGPGSTLAGCVEIGNSTFVGAGSIVLPRIRIGQNSIIGAGSVVTKDIPANRIAFGNPCKIIRDNN